jgi:hypothetical protein
MESDSVSGSVSDGVRQENDLNLPLSEAAAMHLLKYAQEGGLEFRPV